MKKIVLTLIAAMICGFQTQSFASSSVDALIQKLEDKGILTDQDAAQLKDEIGANEKNSQESTFKTLLPDWLNNMKVSGDFRLRDQLQVRKVPLTSGGGHNFDRNRGRMRVRLNFEDQVNDKLKVIVGIATDGEGGTFPGNDRSNNITFGGNAGSEGTFNKSSLVLNKAYAVYTPASWATLMGGQMDNPIWEPASLLWDPDITPIGGVVQLQKRVNDLVTPFSTNAMFILKDNSPSTTTTKTDPYMFVTQEGIKGNLTDKVYYKAAASYYNLSNPTHLFLDNGTDLSGATTIGGNTIFPGTTSKYLYDFELVGGDIELGMNDPLGEMLDNLPVPVYVAQAGVFGSYYQNIEAPSGDNTSWEAGAYVGNSALNGWGTWKLQSYYKVLERDSWVDALPDDDFYSGDTDTAGWRNQLDIGLAKNAWFSLTYFRTHVYKTYGTTTFSQKAPEDLFQMDLNMKF